MSVDGRRNARWVFLLFAVGLGGVGGSTAVAQDAPAKAEARARVTAPILVSDTPLPDPYVIHDGADWYIFGTGAETFFLQGKSLNPSDMRRVALELDYSGFSTPVRHIWGFIVYRHRDGTHHGYGTLHVGDFHTVIAHFRPKEGETWSPGKPITKWSFDRVMIGDVSRGDWNYYETKVVSDGDGTLYLVFVAREGRNNVIVARRLRRPDAIDPRDPPHVLLRPAGRRSEDRDDPRGMQLVEGTSIFRFKGVYILLYSVGAFDKTNYKLGVAFSNTLIPPAGQTYTKVTMPDVRNVWGNPRPVDEIVYLMQSQRSDWPNYSGSMVVGPGLGSIVNYEGRLWLVFHGYKPDDSQRNPANRYVWRVPLGIEIRGRVPTAQWVRVKLDREETGGKTRGVKVGAWGR